MPSTSSSPKRVSLNITVKLRKGGRVGGGLGNGVRNETGDGVKDGIGDGKEDGIRDKLGDIIGEVRRGLHPHIAALSSSVGDIWTGNPIPSSASSAK